MEQKKVLSAFRGITQFKEIGIMIPLLFIIVFTSIFNPTFATADNAINILRNISTTVIGAVGMTFILISGGIDLSVGSALGLSGMITGYCLGVLHLPVVFSILLGMFASAFLGFCNGLIITKCKIPPLIVTLGMMNIGRGIINVMSKGRPYSGFPDSFNNIGLGSLFGIPYSVYISAVIIGIAAFAIRNTVFGRSLMAIGGNEETTRVSGIAISKFKTLSYILVSTLSGITGILIAARLSTSQANAGTGWELTVIASVVIGGTSMYGGSGSIFGTVIGVAIMEVLSVAMTMLRIDPYWQKIVVGIIIILAVGIDTWRRNRMSVSKG